MKFIGLWGVWTHTDSHACKHTSCMTTNSRTRVVLLMKMINKLVKLDVTHATSFFFFFVFILFFEWNITSCCSFTAVGKQKINHAFLLPDRKGKVTAWLKRFPGLVVLCQWPVCLVGDTDGLSKERASHMLSYTLAKLLQETEAFPWFFFPLPSIEEQAVLQFAGFYQYIITCYEEHILWLKKRAATLQLIINITLFTINSLMLCYAATEAYNGVT